MASIDNLKTLINHNVSYSVGSRTRNMSVYVEDRNPQQINCVCLFYLNVDEWVGETKAAYYKTVIQVAVRFSEKGKCRDIAFDILEYINSRRKTLSGVYFIPVTTPTFIGVDEQSQAFWYAFNIEAKGGL